MWALEHAASQQMQCGRDGTTAVAVPNERDMTVCRKGLHEPGELFAREERTAALLVDVAEEVPIDPLARPVKRDEDRIGRESTKVAQAPLDPQQTLDRIHLGSQVPLHKNDDGMTGRLSEERVQATLHEVPASVQLLNL